MKVISPLKPSLGLPHNVGRTLSKARATTLVELEGELEEDVLMDFEEVGDPIVGSTGELVMDEKGKFVSSPITTPKVTHKVNWADISHGR